MWKLYCDAVNKCKEINKLQNKIDQEEEEFSASLRVAKENKEEDKHSEKAHRGEKNDYLCLKFCLST